MAVRRWISSMLLAAATLAAAPLCVAAQALPAENAAEAARKDLLQQQQILADPGSTAQQREQAARRLVSRSSLEADDILLKFLSNFTNPPAQLAVARALSSDLTAEGRFIEPLANLLGPDRNLTEAAAQALAVFKSDDRSREGSEARRARERLSRFVDDLSKRPDSRAAAVKAMGKLVDKETAGTLIQLMGRRDDNPLVRDAAIDALTEMTGLSRYGRDVQQWEMWWRGNRNKSDLEWSTELLRKNASRSAELEKRLLRLRDDMVREIREGYQHAPEADRAKKLIGYLQAESEDVRWAAVKIVYDEAVQFGAGKISPEVLATLRGMVGDSSTEVRDRVARTLTTANDPKAVDALLAQLSLEKDAGVQAAILLALGPSGDLRTIKPLLDSLDDEQVLVAKAAADALRDLAENLRKPENATRAAEVAAKLEQRLRTTERTISAANLRGSLVQAMSRLGNPANQDIFYELLSSGRDEQPRVRIDAIRGLGLIGDPNSANQIVIALEDQDRGVRYEAADALKTTASSFAHVEKLVNRLSENVESDAGVREKAWQVLEVLLAKLSESELDLLNLRFRDELTALDQRARGNGRQDPELAAKIKQALERRLAVLGAAEKKMADRPGDSLAGVRENLGEVLLRLERGDEAAVRFRQALDWWVSQNKPEATTNGPKQNLMRALLQARKYSDAADFATGLISKDKAITSDMWVHVKGEVNRLSDARDLTAALSLVEQAKKVPWGELYSPQLQRLETDLRGRINTGGALWVRQPRRFEHASIFQAPAS